ncbi:efflux RND transporter periplasmic adaptor subunit [Desulfurispirillum indicum]|uniref:efflux RND transporter periplasmic adaptor subunit n=1 Tax=Desulfurispirillum indicum TaxID=936456 RepID=UPI001CFB1079|nr:efflux RND transporter periplasmic adaptor subunit [Desulfurispirillum indicum]UCZ55965.1 efflux RND transporter periplasmic adaptor subunit [Desulfurispirillum indicum]
MNREMQSRRWRPSRRALFLVLPGLVLLAGAGYFSWQHMFSNQKGQQAWSIAQVQKGNIENLVTATGTLQPRNYVDVGAQVSGQMQKIHVEVGTQVQQGELLAEIDPTLFVAKVDATRAQLRYQLAQLRDREAQLILAENHYRRQKNLLAEDATTEENVQNAEASLLSARAQIEMLRAQIDQTESTLRSDEASLNYAMIYAPMDGTVVSVSVRQGQTINASQQAPTILRIADLSTMTVQTQVSEADVSKLRMDMEAYFTTLGSQGRRWYGRLHRVEPTPTVENNVVLYNALFDVTNANRELLPQMTAQVFFVVSSARDALLVPVAALSMSSATNTNTAQRRERPAGTESGDRARVPGGEDGERSRAAATASATSRATVQVALADGTLEPREVEVGVSNRIQAQVLSGLVEGERVAVGVAQAGNSGAARTAAAGSPLAAGGPGTGMPRVR